MFGIELSRPQWSFYLKVLSFALLIIFINGWQAVPMHIPWGVDLQCVWTFHHCEFANNPYLVDGATCGDVYNRPMVYPPLHYWTFAWTRLLEFKKAVIYLALAIVGVLVFSYKFWVPKGRDTVASFGIWVLLLLQYPTFFQIERGSNDLPVYLWFLASLWCFKNRKFFLSGIFIALCACTKLYPVFVMVPVVFAAFFDKRMRNLVWGALLGVFLAHIISPMDSIKYYLEVMPLHASSEPPLGDDAAVSHTLRSLYPSRQWIAQGIFLFVWWAFAWRSLKDIARKPIFIFCLGLAMSTYFAVVSYDYHLILVYPLLFYIYLAAEKAKSPWLYLIFIVGITVYFFDRMIIIHLKWDGVLTKYQFLWLSFLVFFGHKAFESEEKVFSEKL